MKLAAAALTAALALAVQDPEELSFTVLAGFTYTEGMPLPQEVLAYDEKVVTISGFMQREFPGGGPVNQFLLVNEACGCEGSPMMNEVVFCALPEDVTTEVVTSIVEVTGKLYVGEQKEEGIVIMLYTMDADSIKTSSVHTPEVSDAR